MSSVGTGTPVLRNQLESRWSKCKWAQLFIKTHVGAWIYIHQASDRCSDHNDPAICRTYNQHKVTATVSVHALLCLCGSPAMISKPVRQCLPLPGLIIPGLLLITPPATTHRSYPCYCYANYRTPSILNYKSFQESSKNLR